MAYSQKRELKTKTHPDELSRLSLVRHNEVALDCEGRGVHFALLVHPIWESLASMETMFRRCLKAFVFSIAQLKQVSFATENTKPWQFARVSFCGGRGILYQYPALSAPDNKAQIAVQFLSFVFVRL